VLKKHLQLICCRLYRREWAW